MDTKLSGEKRRGINNEEAKVRDAQRQKEYGGTEAKRTF